MLIGSALGLIVGASNIYLGLKTGFSFGASLFGYAAKALTSSYLMRSCGWHFHLRAIFGFAILKPLSTLLPKRYGGGCFGPKENCQPHLLRRFRALKTYSRPLRHNPNSSDRCRESYWALSWRGPSNVSPRAYDDPQRRHEPPFPLGNNIGFLRSILCREPATSLISPAKVLTSYS